ncbi:cytochrome P450 [Thermoflavimicrobium daqui]|uniref:cytochrome P450 n=1 Tax=Thermoflavimicrobium daqui TaxID=2137476 RepID=UPI0023E7892C|nr:cytochrome P450 [Thermoflavimicrobium daqui]
MEILIQRITRMMPLVTIVPIKFPGSPYYQALRTAEKLDSYIRSMITQKRAQTETTDVLASLIHANDEDGKSLSDEELIGHTFTLFVAGHETTANALTWTIFLLAQHPHILANLLDELDYILHGNAPTIEQLRQLPLLDGVIKESLRLLPPASIGTRITATSCELKERT